jgi:hypothetical protein
VPRKWCCESFLGLLPDPKDQPWPSLTRPDCINTPQSWKDEKGPLVIGAGRTAFYMDTRVETVGSPINVAIASSLADTPSPTTIEGITPSSTTPKHVPITRITRASSSQASMPRRNRLNPNGNGPDDFGRDSPVRGWGTGQSKLVAADSAAEAETGWRAGCEAPSEDSRPDPSSRTGSRP